VHISCGILSVAVMLIIANTLRLTIYQRQEEMQVYKLLGATDAYVSRPFLYSGMAYAFFGALLALLLVKAVLLSISRSNVFVMHQDLLQLHQRQVFAVLIISLLLGWVSAKLCVKIKNSYLYL
jgi:cell division transport system permease protein